MFASPIAYLIGETGLIADNVAVGVEPILVLLNKAKCSFAQDSPT